MYFKHSKFQSFVRQLNFYGFHKLRTDPDLNSDSNTVHFGHEFFKRGQPDLLYRIQRSTRGASPPSGSGGGGGGSSLDGFDPSTVASVEQVESLKQEVFQMNKQLEKLSTTIDFKLASLTTSIEADYQRRMEKIEHSYKILSELAFSAVGTSSVTATTQQQELQERRLSHQYLLSSHQQQQQRPSFTYGVGSPRTTMLIPDPKSTTTEKFNTSSLFALSGLASMVSSSQNSLTTTGGVRPLSPP